MFEELYKKDARITKSLKNAWRNYPLAIRQLDEGSLSSVLIAKRICQEPTSPQSQLRQFSLGNTQSTAVVHSTDSSCSL